MTPPLLLCYLEVMVPLNETQFITMLMGLVNYGVIPISRIEDAVDRILIFTVGPFENPWVDNSFGRTAILNGITAAINLSTDVVFGENPDAQFIKSGNFSYAIVVYAETAGDSTNLKIPDPGPSVISNVCRSVKCVVVADSGRLVVIQPYSNQIEAWLQQGCLEAKDRWWANVLFGDYGSTWALLRTWFKQSTSYR
ncbi:hypothetical protein MLD38_040256 [Melastoma candidum]|uniref:Uncharacterized protein n=1 Tax=Melastoma candidum TaxID=119954 RepID=A0ACB9L5U8_9MYRT|nr:hypothetical protein MLD38_040256 [Melastoma candidum]